MSNSALATYTNISANKTSPRNATIDTVSIHCVVAQWTAQQTVDYLQPSTRKASCNYAVGKDGSIAIGVEEKDRSWCTSDPSNDHRAITIEVASDTTDPYAITDAAYSALVKLLADICQRNSGLSGGLKWQGDSSLIGTVSKQNMTVHRWFASKACPGDYLYNLHGQIAADVNTILNGEDEENQEDKLVEDGSIGRKSVVRWQEIRVSSPQDGEVSNQSLAVEEYHSGCSSAVWEYNNTGKGSNLIKAHQEFLNEEIGSELKVILGAVLSKDGNFGGDTIKGTKIYLNKIMNADLTVDKYFDKAAAIALQKWMNAQD